MVDLRTITGVELAQVGTWQISTGQWRVTSELLAAAVAAHSAGDLPAPILKVGHTDERFTAEGDGEPALGRVENLRLADGGQTLVGDFVGVPGWLADIIASAYPRRSIEAMADLELSGGRKYPLVLTAVALLGVTRPGITTLADLRETYGVAAAAGTPILITVRAPITAVERAQLVAAARAARRQRSQAAAFVALSRGIRP